MSAGTSKRLRPSGACRNLLYGMGGVENLLDGLGGVELGGRMIDVHFVTFDCAQPYELATFWSKATGWEIHPDDGKEDDEVLLQGKPSLLFIRVPEGSRPRTACTWTSPDPMAQPVIRRSSGWWGLAP